MISGPVSLLLPASSPPHCTCRALKKQCYSCPYSGRDGSGCWGKQVTEAAHISYVRSTPSISQPVLSYMSRFPPRKYFTQWRCLGSQGNMEVKLRRQSCYLLVHMSLGHLWELTLRKIWKGSLEKSQWQLSGFYWTHPTRMPENVHTFDQLIAQFWKRKIF